jgi:hypothetical protein
MDFAPLPAGPGAPAIDDIASAIVCGFPMHAREQARLVLVSCILPWDLRGAESFADPRRLVATAYAALVDVLRMLAPDDRLHELEAQALRRRSQQLLDLAVGVAVARWAHDRAHVALPAPWNELADRYRDLDTGGFHDEITRQLAEVDQLETLRSADPARDPRARRLMRPHLLLARFTLGVARRAVFDAASGPLLVFLREMGAETRDVTFELQRPRTDRIAKLRRPIVVPPDRAK